MTIERFPITDHASWLAMRKQDITASVAGAFVGVHPYQTAYGLYLLKSGLVEEDAEETPPMKRGRLLEPVAHQLLLDEKPDWRLDRYPVGLYLRDPEARVGATPDVMGYDEQGRRIVVQIKTVEPGVFRREWKAPDGSIEPPLWIVVQAIIEAHLTGAEQAYVAPMVVGFGLEMPVVPVPIHVGIIDRIKTEIKSFWAKVDAKTPPPPDYARDGALISKMFPADSGTEIYLGSDNRIPILCDELDAAKAAIKEAEAKKTTAENEIKAKLGENTVGRLGDGRTITWKLQHRKGFEVAPTSFRALRISNGRAK